VPIQIPPSSPTTCTATIGARRPSCSPKMRPGGSRRRISPSCPSLAASCHPGRSRNWMRDTSCATVFPGYTCLRNMEPATLTIRNTGNLFRDYFEPSRVFMKGGRVMTIHDPGTMKPAAHGLELNLQKAEPFKLPAQDLTGIIDMNPRYRQRRAIVSCYV